jgi:ankyrin repeat protein
VVIGLISLRKIMKIRLKRLFQIQTRTMKIRIALLLMFGATAPVLAGGTLPAGLGDGRPGLCIIYDSSNEYAVFIDEALEKSWKPGDDWMPDYRSGPIQGLAEYNLGLETLNPKIRFVYNTVDLFPFDEQTVFTCDGFIGTSWFPRTTMVFSTNADSILLSTNVYALSRQRYGLATNQWFLGKIGPNIFYWETGKPRMIYFRTPEEKHRVNYFKLPRADADVFGVKKAVSAGKDVGFCVDRKLSWFERLENLGTAMAQPAFIEFSLGDAKSKRLPKSTFHAASDEGAGVSVRRTGGYNQTSLTNSTTGIDGNQTAAISIGTGIYNAAKSNRLEIVEAMVERKPRLAFSKDDDEWTLLHIAALNGYGDMVKFLLANKAKVNAKEEAGDTPLVLAAENGHKDVVELLLAAGANVDAKGDDGSPLAVAAAGGYVDIVKLLLSRNADVNSWDSEGGTPIVSAKTREIAELIVAKGANVNSRDYDRQTALHIAAAYGRSDLAAFLMAQGADVNARDRYGDTPLHYAASDSTLRMDIFNMKPHAPDLPLDAQAGSVINLRDSVISRTDSCLELAKLLLANKADVNVKDGHGDTPLHYAAATGDINLVSLLLAYKANINTKDRDGSTPLHLAICWHGDDDIEWRDRAEFLRRHGGRDEGPKP